MYDKMAGEASDYKTIIGNNYYEFDKDSLIRIGKWVEKLGVQVCYDLGANKHDLDSLIYKANNKLHIIDTLYLSDYRFKENRNTIKLEEGIKYLLSDKIANIYFGKDFFDKDIISFVEKYINIYNEHMSNYEISNHGNIKGFIEYFNNIVHHDTRLDQKYRNTFVKKSSVYLIKDLTLNTYKIGVSKNPEKRLLQLQTANSNNLILIGKTHPIHYAFRLEKDWHYYLNDYRIKSEWFLLNDEQVNNLVDEMNHYTTIERFE